MRQYTVITKDGSKWLRPVRDCVEAQDYIDEMIDNAFGVADIPYLGSRPEGTTLDESEVREVRQHKIGGKWHVTTSDLSDTGFSDYWELETRIAYIDAGYTAHPNVAHTVFSPYPSHDASNENPRYPLFSHMSSEHGLTLLDSELDEIARHAAPMTGVEYWKERCKVVEQMIGMCPSDPKTYDEFCRLYDEWEQIIEKGRAYGN